MGQKLVISVATTILLLTGILLGYVLSQLVLGYLSLNLLTFLGTFSLIVIFGTLYYVLFWELKRQQQAQAFRPAPAAPAAAPKPQSNPKAPDAYLKNRLIALLAGDENAAQDIVEQGKQQNPGMPENWYWERAIADIERDKS
ncbi:hypothetical protein [Calothrix sp. 336/3]|uniref:hypothetical protein n=1 Tax=Calothrix sp. 336/3 TaxID=1337936 RepID=UPI0004E31C5A|nr:hypothetical protein [Calothrix sp. 336/3]AKG21948.1 hypothetical protein IJ00_12380 [Calothrix sp. 336/3]